MFPLCYSFFTSTLNRARGKLNSTAPFSLSRLAQGLLGGWNGSRRAAVMVALPDHYGYYLNNQL